MAEASRNTSTDYNRFVALTQRILTTPKATLVKDSTRPAKPKKIAKRK